MFFFFLRRVALMHPQFQGIIEVVPNAISRDQLGKRVEGSLFDYFQGAC